ncbi:MAG: iron export ABC transporter permease subunit FetB [Firmicutes bacterium]|nr:iron export ABC transporter permease subunit FetB [Bacillota bacterium]
MTDSNSVNSYIHITYLDLLIALALIAIAAAISRWQRLGMERDMAVGTVRAFVQLLAVGLVLQQIFNAARWYWVILALAVMTSVAGWNAMQRQAGPRRGVFPLMAGAIAIGSALALAIVIGVVLRVRPWYQPQYVIPIAGMVIGNAMNGAALVVGRLRSEILNRRNEVEAALALGASARVASESALREALRAAMVPTINSLMTVGIVQLPGMMTGQIISGARPADAVRYQIVVLLMIAAATAITAMAAGFGAFSLFFTPAHQISPYMELGRDGGRYRTKCRG